MFVLSLVFVRENLPNGISVMLQKISFKVFKKIGNILCVVSPLIDNLRSQIGVEG